MKIKLTVLVTVFLVAVSSLAYSFDSINGTLGTTPTATDIILFKCSTQPGITVASAAVRDYDVIFATPPNISVQIGNANSTTTCTGATDWTTVKTTIGENSWSPRTRDITVSQTSPSNYYCIKVTKATATAIVDDYQLNHQCERIRGANGINLPRASTFISYTQNQ